jgi:hypothetical protein
MVGEMENEVVFTYIYPRLLYLAHEYQMARIVRYTDESIPIQATTPFSKGVKHKQDSG